MHVSRCGDGALDDGEGCDDGNSADDDACLACVPARCGDGVVWAGRELCDAVAAPDAAVECTADCTVPTCGDGLRQGLERCDDANADDGDACTRRCLEARCGDGFVHAPPAHHHRGARHRVGLPQ